MSKEEKTLVVIFCAPLGDYPEPPTDQSICTKEECPTCKNMMWLSEKKKTLLQIAKSNEIQTHLECYNCFMKTVKADPEIWKDHLRVNI